MIDVRHGDCLEVMRGMPDCSVDAVVTDPPYQIGFMGKAWDRQAAHEEWAAECLRLLKPGGHLLAFGGTRTYHRLTAGIEDAGFEIRDSIVWLYGSGFPKSHDVSKAIDKAAGAERGVVRTAYGARNGNGNNADYGAFGSAADGTYKVTAPATEAARQWAGWGTALKPAHEPIVVARKPLAGTVAANVSEWHTGAINVDACRVEYQGDAPSQATWNGKGGTGRGSELIGQISDGMKAAYARGEIPVPSGRWPPNVVLTHAYDCQDPGPCAEGCPVAELDQQSGTTVSARKVGPRSGKTPGTYGAFTGQADVTRGHDDSGGASRYFPAFRWQAKAPPKQRPRVDGVSHPTVKPLALIQWLCRLVTPPGGVVLDPYLGSGTTAEACHLEGFSCIGIEREAEYLPLIAERLTA